ncbi:MAG: hypothetical protein C0483_01235 [Pirellula sp.]|nr:hypothetical protein [Pirellula sp.]
MKSAAVSRPAKPSASSKWSRRPAAVGLVLLVLSAFANSFYGVPVWDDIEEITRNEHLHEWWPPWQAMTGGKILPPRPLPYWTFAVDYNLWGPSGPGWHLMNVGVHLLSALFLFGIVRRALLTPRLEPRYGNAAVGLAFFTAALWAVHPLQTQAVTYIYQRMESMAGMFCLASLYCFQRAAAEPGERRWGILSAVAAAAGMLCKESAVAVMPVIFLYDRCLLNDSFGQTISGRWAYYVGLALGCVPMFVFFAVNSARYSELRYPDTEGPWSYPLSQPGVILRYLRLCFWPTGQCLDYKWKPAASFVEIAVPAALLIIPLVVALRAYSRRPALSWFIIAFYLLLGPTSSFLAVSDLAMEHRMYLPSAVVVGAVVLGVYELLLRADDVKMSRRAMVAGVGLCIVAGLAVGTHLRNRVYYSRIAMWSDVVAKAPHNARAFGNLASAYHRAEDYTAAMHAGKRALELNDNSRLVHLIYGSVTLRHGDRDTAVWHLAKALEMDPNDSMACVNLGVALRPSDPERARSLFQHALDVDGACVEALYNLANDKARRGDFLGAKLQFEQAIALAPDDTRLQAGLATVLDDLRQGGHSAPQ